MQITKNKFFPGDPTRAILNSFDIMEEEFYKKSVNSKGEITNKSGSCAIVVLFVGNSITVIFIITYNFDR